MHIHMQGSRAKLRIRISKTQTSIRMKKTCKVRYFLLVFFVCHDAVFSYCTCCFDTTGWPGRADSTSQRRSAICLPNSPYCKYLLVVILISLLFSLFILCSALAQTTVKCICRTRWENGTMQYSVAKRGTNSVDLVWTSSARKACDQFLTEVPHATRAFSSAFGKGGPRFFGFHSTGLQERLHQLRSSTPLGCSSAQQGSARPLHQAHSTTAALAQRLVPLRTAAYCNSDCLLFRRHSDCFR
jgi:hypothetical protein